LNASIVASKGLPSFSVYSATKAAVRSFARSWTNDLRSRRIRVNAVSPGIVPTPGYTVGLKFDGTQVDEFVQGMLPQIPAGRVGTADEIAKAVSFLAGDESSYVTGASSSSTAASRRSDTAALHTTFSEGLMMDGPSSLAG